MATILVNQTNGGMLQQYVSSTWTALRNTSTALNVSLETGQIKAWGISEINRVYLSFDTSTLSMLDIASLTLNISINYIQETPSIMVLKSPTNNSTNLNVSNFGIYPTTEYCNSPIYPTSNGLYSINLNGNAIYDAVTNGELNLVLVDYTYDYLDVAPPSSSYTQVNIFYPTVYLEYGAYVSISPDSLFTYGKVNGITAGSIYKMNGLFVANP
jgi:hypothetical protein